MNIHCICTFTHLLLPINQFKPVFIARKCSCFFFWPKEDFDDIKHICDIIQFRLGITNYRKQRKNKGKKILCEITSPIN